MDQEIETVDPETPETASDPRVEAEARLLGWRPEDEFNGPADRWKPAEEFLEEGKRINGYLRKDLEKLRAELASRDANIAALQQSMTEFAAFHKETEKKAYERAVRDLKAERREALRDNDGERVAEIEDQIEQLAEASPARIPGVPQVQTPPPVDPAWAAWLSENDWFNSSPKTRAITNGYGDLLRTEQPNLVGRPFLDEVTRRVREDFPQWFENPARNRPNAVGGAGEQRNEPSSRAKTYAALPPDVKLQCDKFVKQGLVASREAYCADYFGE